MFSFVELQESKSHFLDAWAPTIPSVLSLSSEALSGVEPDQCQYSLGLTAAEKPPEDLTRERVCISGLHRGYCPKSRALVLTERHRILESGGLGLHLDSVVQ